MTVAASESLPCNRISGLSGRLWPGGRAIAQLVFLPPRAWETNDPETNVGAAASGAGARGIVGAGCCGAGGAAAVVDDCDRAPMPKAPTAPAVAPTPSRRTSRRLTEDMWSSCHRRPDAPSGSQRKD